MNIAVLDTGLFPDRETLEHALDELEPHYNVYRLRLAAPSPDDAAWDQILDEILAADRVVVL